MTSDLTSESSGNGNMVATVDYLADHMQYIQTLAKWHHDTWLYLSPNTTLDARARRLRSNAQRGHIPVTFIALRGADPVGCASVVTSDMSVRQHLSPWLASVYVVPELRNAGIGSQLVARAIKEAKAMGEKQLYLYTPDRQSFYARLGWCEIEICEYRGYVMSIMQYELD